jgi:hypothetical protein
MPSITDAHLSLFIELARHGAGPRDQDERRSAPNMGALETTDAETAWPEGGRSAQFTAKQ